MYVINLVYCVPIEKIEEILPAHIKFLEEQYKSGHFIASGRKKPRIGGIIIAKDMGIDELNNIINQDPYKINGLAEYSITEFIPTMTCTELNHLKQSV